jgi:hypothetical protein
MQMASQRQVEANRHNALKSTGPKTREGKAISRANAVKHGLAADVLVSDSIKDALDARLAEWDDHYKPDTPDADFAVATAVACTFRIEECQANLEAIAGEHCSRARRTWDLDRAADAAVLLGKLSKRPEVILPQLEASKHGAELLLTLWGRLALSLESKDGAWSAEEVATAFDLCGVPRQLRDGRAPFDPAEPGADVHEHRRLFLVEQGDRLIRSLSGGLDRADHDAKGYTATAAFALTTKRAALVLRYEREAWKRYDAMLAAVKWTSQPQAAPKKGVAPPRKDVEYSPEVVEEMLGEMEAEIENPRRPDPSVEFEPAAKTGRPLNRRARRRMAAISRHG